MRTRTIQETGKFWKLLQALAWVVALGGGSMVAVATLNPPEPDIRMVWAGAAVALVSLPLWMVGRVGRWWFHA